MEEKIVSEEGSRTRSQNTVDENLDLKSKLSALECPFTWNLAESIAPIKSWLFFSCKSKLEKPDQELPDGKDEWYKLATLLLLVYMQMEEDINQALVEIKECENIMNQLKEKRSRFLEENKFALKHIVLATKAHLMNNPASIQLVLQEIDKNPLSSMTKKELAGIKGFKAEVFLQLGKHGHSLALPFAEAAIGLNENESYWWYLAGKALARARRLREYWEYQLSENQDIVYLQKAVDLENCSSYVLLLASTYMEIASYIRNSYPKSERYLKRRVNEMQKKSYELYISCIKDEAIPAHRLIRCAHGLLRLPHPYKQVNEAKRIINKCLALIPDNGYVHHVAAMFYENYELDVNKAIHHLDIASSIGVFDAESHKISIKCYSDKEYDPYNDLKLCKEKYTDVTLQQILEREFGMYYLICKQDLITALKHFAVVIRDGKGSSLKAAWNNFTRYKEDRYIKINILKILVDEARLAFPKSNTEEEVILKNFLADIERLFPELLEHQPESNQIKNLVSKKGKTKIYI